VIPLALLRFLLWEAAVLAASLRLARWIGWQAEDAWLGTLSIDVAIESSIAGALSFAGWNSAPLYWAAAVGLAIFGLWRWPGFGKLRVIGDLPYLALAAPLVLLAFRPVQEIDSINYLHYLIDWMGDRATPYTFATNYVAFWELSFLPAWMVTGVDSFFPLLALKAVLLMGLAVWLAGRELGVSRTILQWTVCGALAMRHYWYEYSGVPTLKNDVLHGVGFVVLALVVLRAARGSLARGDMVLLALGLSFAAVKYTGIFIAVIALGILLAFRVRPPLWIAGVFVLTSGHYYLRSILNWGSPFYPFQINLGPIHLPGTADLSYTSILFNLHDPRLWRAFFLPADGISPAGILFPEILIGTLVLCSWRCVRWLFRRTRPDAVDCSAFLILCGWLLYFRSVFSACGSPGDLQFVLNGLNSLRYVDGVLALSEVYLVLMLGRFALPLVAVNLVSRLALLYVKLPLDLFPPLAVAALALAVFLISRRWAWIPLAVCIVACPYIVERNRVHWTSYWDDLKPALAAVRGPELAEFAMPIGSYYAGHVVAAGNPVAPAVRALLPEEVRDGTRPRYLAVLPTPESPDWQSQYGGKLAEWGYRVQVLGRSGALLTRDFR
jgi:hypothetical protein